MPEYYAQRLNPGRSRPQVAVFPGVDAKFIIVFLQKAMLISLGQFAFGVDYLRQPAGTLLMMVTLALWAACLGLFIGTLAKGEEQVVMYSLIAMFIFSALGGAWFPLEIAGRAFASIGHILPTAWAMTGFQNIREVVMARESLNRTARGRRELFPGRRRPGSERSHMVEHMHIRVLIVDDQPRARQSLKALLATWLKAGEIQEVSSGKEALRLLEGFRPDVILMDARMPEMDGLEATRLIKTRWPEVKIVVLSMYPDYEAPALTAGADAFVCKSELPERLLAMLEVVAPGDERTYSGGPE